MYLGLNHENAAHSHLIDDGKDVNNVFLLQLLSENVKCYERSRTTHSSTVQTSLQYTLCILHILSAGFRVGGRGGV